VARPAPARGRAVHPGHRPDIIARFVAERLSPKLGHAVVVENVPGASGNIGSQQVARAKADGTTLMSSVNTLVMNASLYKNLPYDPVTDFAPSASPPGARWCWWPIPANRSTR